MPLLGLLVAALFVANLGAGAYVITPLEIVEALGILAGLQSSGDVSEQALGVLAGIRLPRALMAAAAGAGLGLAGAVLQGLFRNPLADPGVIGVSSGAALGAAIAIVGVAALPPGLRLLVGGIALPASAFVFSLATTLLVYRVGRVGLGGPVATLLLAGIAFNALAFAGVGFLSYVATDEQLRNLSFWNLGSLSGATWQQLGMCALAGLPAAAILLRLAPGLDALSLGNEEARHLGVDVTRLQRAAVVCTALLVGCLVAYTGVIGFLGLVAPHMVRLGIGPSHRLVLPTAGLLGGALLLGADMIARTSVAPAELPVGIVTTAAGAPFFLWLLARARRQAPT